MFVPQAYCDVWGRFEVGIGKLCAKLTLHQGLPKHGPIGVNRLIVNSIAGNEIVEQALMRQEGDF